MKLLYLALSCLLVLSGHYQAEADLVRTKDGSILTGTIEKIDEGILELATTFAGTLSIEMEQVAGFSTEKKAFLRLEDGSEPAGTVQDRPGQPLQVTGAAEIDVPKASVNQLWRTVERDPVLLAEQATEEAKRKKWKSSVSLDLTGSSGNSEDFGLSSQFKGAYGNDRATTKFYLSYHKSHKSGETTSDESKAGVEHSSLFGDKLGWYVKTDLESDRLEEIDLRTTTAGGVKYAILNRVNQELSARSGFAFRHEKFDNGSSLDGPAMDFGIDHAYRLTPRLSVVSELDYVPSIEDFGDYRISQDTGLEVPLTKGGRWKLRMGFANDYNSRPATSKENLDLRYYSRLVFSWE